MFKAKFFIKFFTEPKILLNRRFVCEKTNKMDGKQTGWMENKQNGGKTNKKDGKQTGWMENKQNGWKTNKMDGKQTKRMENEQNGWKTNKRMENKQNGWKTNKMDGKQTNVRKTNNDLRLKKLIFLQLVKKTNEMKKIRKPFL